MPPKKPHLDEPSFKIIALRGLCIAIISLITIRLFYLQIVRHDFYQQVAAKEHYGYTELPARRGEIFIKDYASGEDVRVATNVTLDTLFADPTIIENPQIVADRIAPLIFNLEDERAKDEARIAKAIKQGSVDEETLTPLTDEKLYEQYHSALLESISKKIRSEILLSDTLEEGNLEAIEALHLPGIERKDTKLYAYPKEIENRAEVASTLNQYIEISPNRLEQILQGKNRYVVLSKKVEPEVAAKIRQITEEDENDHFFGLGLSEEYYRFYPEAELAANVLGFVTPGGIGQYGIESKFNTQLQGKKGVFQTQRDGSIYSRQITVGDSVIEPAQDGHDIILTLDRSMQMTIESILARAVQGYQADSGQVIVMDPDTGKVMALAHYPSFDPNQFGNALQTVDINLSPEEVNNLVPIENNDDPNDFWFYRNVSAHDRFKVMRVPLDPEDETKGYLYQRFKNWIGLEAYQNKIVGEPYEPGSVFKSITMAIAIDDNDVTPRTSFYDPGILEKDEFEITNISSNCTGTVTMSDILAYSCNTGIGRVADIMGRSLFYSYMQKFGFNERSGIEFDNEHPGFIEHFTQWADSELATHAFGQGFTATPLQMATAYAAIANGGKLVQPHIVEKIIEENGREVITEAKTIGTVISEDTAQKITAILTNAVENGVASNARVENHYIAAKTGTSQTYKHGKPLEGAGTTLTSIAGFGPIADPKFVLLVKLNRPRSSQWASDTAANIFSEIATYLYDYLGVPPDRAT